MQYIPDVRTIRFKFSPRKVRAALHWMIWQAAGTDLHTILKACYFADKEHLNIHNRPIFGATYRAMRFGPLPLEIYEMAKGEPIWLPETDAQHYPWRMDGYRLWLVENSPPDLSPLSQTDTECLERGFCKAREISFDERTAATHGRDWQAAELGLMSYEDMIEDSPRKPEIVEYLRENARFLRL